MKRQLICFISLLVLSNECFAQQTDPTLTAAVGAQSAMLNNLFSKREKTQKKIIAAETAVTVAMDRMHKVEDQMLEYLSNAQGAMQNLYQIKRAAELVTTEIPQNMNLVKKSLPGHLKGTAIAILVSDELTDAATQMASLYPFMKQRTDGCSYADGQPLSVHEAVGDQWQLQRIGLRREGQSCEQETQGEPAELG